MLIDSCYRIVIFLFNESVQQTLDDSFLSCSITRGKSEQRSLTPNHIFFFVYSCSELLQSLNRVPLCSLVVWLLV